MSFSPRSSPAAAGPVLDEAARLRERLARAGLLAPIEAVYFGTEDERPRFAVAAVTSEILDEAARLSARHGLRASDAVQLATAMAVRTADPSCTDIAVFDTALRDAAAAEGSRTIPAERANTS
jgi:predicted nucleic acid-binding protein